MIYFLALLFSFNVYASLNQTSSNTSAIASALGGAGRAAVGAGDISSLNPASLVYLYGYNFYTRYQPGESAIGISDNTRETVVPAALYVYQNKDLKNFKLSFAEPFARRAALGVSLGYYQAKVGSQNINLANIDIGATYLIKANMALGVVLYDLNKTPENWPSEQRIDPKFGVGYHYAYKGFLRTRVDYLSAKNFQLTEGSWMFGLEDYMNRWTIVRLGYQENPSDISDLMTIGMGFDLPKFKINYAYLTETKDNSQVRHSVDFTVPF
jgi:hypothetical protein